MKHVWMVSTVPFEPVNAGNRIRINALIRAFQQLGHEVHFIHITEESGDVEAMRRSLPNGHFHQVPSSRNRSVPSVVRRLAKKVVDRAPRVLRSRGFHLQNRLDDYCDDSMVRAVAEQLHGQQVDVLIVEYVFLSAVFRAAPTGAWKIVDTHDLFSNRYRLYGNALQPYTWFTVPPSEERRGLLRADSVLAIQDVEARQMQEMTGSGRIHVVGHLTDIERLGVENPNGIAYAASANESNIQSIGGFIREVLPALVARFPDCRLYLAGSICKADVGEHPAIERLGFVDDLRTLYSKGPIVVNPALFGTGLKIKSIEAMGFGRALVSSAEGAKGLDDGGGKNFAVCGGWPQFTACLMELFENPKKLEALAEGGLSYAVACNAMVIETLAASMEK